MDEIDKNKIEQYMLDHEIPTVDRLLRILTAAQKCVGNIAAEIAELEASKGLINVNCWEES